METKLLPCPFCGEKMSMHHDHSQHKWGYFMACENKKCSVRPTQMARHDSEKEAMASWNTLALSERHQRLVEAAKGARTVMDMTMVACFGDCFLREECRAHGAGCLILEHLDAALAAMEG